MAVDDVDTVSVGAVLTFMQKSLSPFEAVAVTVVSVFNNAPGIIEERLKSTLTEVVPFLMGKDRGLKVSEPAPSGKEHVFDWLASPLQETEVIPALASRSKVAPVTSSSMFPVPVMVAFWPVVTVAGVKPV